MDSVKGVVFTLHLGESNDKSVEYAACRLKWQAVLAEWSNLANLILGSIGYIELIPARKPSVQQEVDRHKKTGRLVRFGGRTGSILHCSIIPYYL